MKRKLLNGLSLALALTLLLALGAGCSSGGDSSNGAANTDAAANGSDAGSSGTTEPYITMKWADHNADGCMTAQSMDVMAEAVFEATEGRVKIDMYHGGVLGTFADSISMVENGVCDIVWTSTSMFAGYFPYSEIFQLPMLGFTNAQDMTEAWWDLMETYPECYDYEFGDYILWMAHASPAACIGADKAIESPSDLNGLNLRAAAGPAATIATLWGANPVSLSPADMYLSMQKGVINGYLFDGAGINTWGLAELTSNVIDCGLSSNVDFIFINKDAWNSLTPEDQEIMMELGGRVGSQTGATYMQEEADTLFGNFDGEYQLLTADDPLYAELKAPLENMYTDWVESVNAAGYTSYDAQEILDFILERAEAYAD